VTEISLPFPGLWPGIYWESGSPAKQFDLESRRPGTFCHFFRSLRGTLRTLSATCPSTQLVSELKPPKRMAVYLDMHMLEHG
jgi:hypothetical protein